MTQQSEYCKNRRKKSNAPLCARKGLGSRTIRDITAWLTHRPVAEIRLHLALEYALCRKGRQRARRLVSVSRGNPCDNACQGNKTLKFTGGGCSEGGPQQLVEKSEIMPLPSREGGRGAHYILD